MTPHAALAMQIDLYRRMTCEQRLQIEVDRYEFACDVAREGIRAQHPGIAEEQVEVQLRWRIELSRRG